MNIVTIAQKVKLETNELLSTFELLHLFDQHPKLQAWLAALATQHLNNNQQIIYGAYLIGSNWHFSLLDGKKYTISEAFLITRPAELRQILLMLR